MPSSSALPCDMESSAAWVIIAHEYTQRMSVLLTPNSGKIFHISHGKPLEQGFYSFFTMDNFIPEMLRTTSLFSREARVRHIEHQA